MKNVEDIYALTPMQELMLMHGLSQRQNDVLFNQAVYTLRGSVDLEILRQCWQQIVDRHTALRTLFSWKDVRRPVQIVRRSVTLPFEFIDLSRISSADQETRIADFLERDWQTGFDFDRAPLMRLAVLQLGDSAYRLIWSSHHLVLDRWCIPIIQHEFLQLYRSANRAESDELQQAPPFRNYVNWIRHQDEQRSLAYWQQTLTGFKAPEKNLTDVLGGSGAANDGRFSEVAIQITPDELREIRQFVQRNELTTANLLTGAWALVVGDASECTDVVCGVAVAGRPSDLEGVESTVGTFINNVPLRARYQPEMRVVDFLKDIQAQDFSRRPFEYIAPGRIHESCGFPPSRQLFDTLMVYNVSVDQHNEEDAGVVLIGHDGKVQTAANFTMAVNEESNALSVVLSSKLADQEALATTIKRFREKVAWIVTKSGSNPSLRPLISELRSPLPAAAAEIAHAKKAIVADSLSPTDAVTEPNLENTEHEVLRQQLQHEWCETLGIDQIGLDDDFFEVGGTSILAAQLCSRVELLTGMSVPLLHLFRFPTIGGMVSTIREKEWPKHPEMLIPVQAKGTRPPIFCITAPDVNPVGYSLLARHLGPQQPTFVVQTPTNSENRSPMVPEDLPLRAAIYIDAIRKAGHQEPYHLLGMCSGAHLAFEMAKQLNQQGQRVARLVIINTWAFNTITRRYYLSLWACRIRWYQQRWKWFWNLGRGQKAGAFADVTGRKFRRLVGRRAASVETNAGESAVKHAGDAWLHANKTSRIAPIEKYPGRVTVFRLKPQQTFRTGDHDLGWGRHAEQVDVHMLPGDEHLRILLEPEVSCVADELGNCLAEAQKRD